MKENNFLPIGTVVILKDKLILYSIIGYLHNSLSKIYDYIIVPFPLGLTDEKSITYCNNSDIEKQVFLGYKTNEYEEYTSILTEKYWRTYE